MAFVILVVLIAAAEVVFAVRAVKTRASKAGWRRDRLALRTSELAIALIARFVPAFGNSWRFTGFLAVVVVLFVWAVVAYLVGRAKAGRAGVVTKSDVHAGGTADSAGHAQNADAEHAAHHAEGVRSSKHSACRPRATLRTRGAAIRGAVLSTLLLAVAAFPAYVFTGYQGLPTTGEHQVAEAQAIFVDANRLEPRESDGSHREVPIYFFYPADASPASAAAQAAYPLVVFDHGSFGYYQSNMSTYQELASNGYVVAVVEHPYYSLFTHDTSGSIVPVDPQFMQAVIDVTNDALDANQADALVREWMTTRDADLNLVLDSIETAQAEGSLSDAWVADSPDQAAAVLQAVNRADLDKIGLMGHSIGGAASMDLARQRTDVDAVIDIDGTMLGEEALVNGSYQYNPAPFATPLLALNNEQHGQQYAQGNPDGTQYVNAYVIEHAADAHSLTFKGTEHMDFTDLPLFSPMLAGMLGSQNIDHEQFSTRINHIILEYCDYYLKGEGSLAGLDQQGD